jgi:hypothetical protein
MPRVAAKCTTSTTGTNTGRNRIDTAELHAYIDRAESIEHRSATFEEETATERGASDDRQQSMWLTADSVPARLLLPGGAGSRTWDTLGNDRACR